MAVGSRRGHAATGIIEERQEESCRADGLELRPKKGLRHSVKQLGPGLITGASDDDPSGIGTYSMAGAAFGCSTLWTGLVVFPMMVAVQYTCAKIAMVTGRGLTAVLRRHYSRNILYPVIFGLLIANTINAGADISAIASAINLIVPIPTQVLIVPIGLTILTLQLAGSYRQMASAFKWLTLALLAYVGAAWFAKPDLAEVVRGTFVPTIQFNSSFLAMLVAIFGTTISPYLFFWQADQEVEEQKNGGQKKLWQRRGTNKRDLRNRAWDVRVGMFLACFVQYSIILATAGTLFHSGQHDISTASQAAAALRPVAGNAASMLFALGIIGSGFLAVPILTASAAYALSQMYGWKHGLDRPVRHAPEFYSVIAVSTLIGLVLNFVGINPMLALFGTAVINGLLAPPLLVLIMIIANNKKIMGEHTNGPLTNIFGWAATAIMFAAAAGLLATFHHWA